MKTSPIGLFNNPAIGGVTAETPQRETPLIKARRGSYLSALSSEVSSGP